MTLRDFADCAVHMPPGSATERAADPDWQITPEVLLLREVEHAVRVVAWQKTKDASLSTPRQYPERVPVTKAQRDAAAIHAATSGQTPDVLPVDELKRRLRARNGR